MCVARRSSQALCWTERYISNSAYLRHREEPEDKGQKANVIKTGGKES